MITQQKSDKQLKVPFELVDNFIRSIQAMNFSRLKRYLSAYGYQIVNCLQSRTRLPCIYFAIQLNDQNNALTYIKQLLKYSANIHFRDSYGNNYLHYSCIYNKLTLFKFFFQMKVNVNERNIYRQSILFTICKNNNQQILHFLTKQPIQINVNEVDQFGRTPIFYAAEQGHLRICEMLLLIGASLDIVDLEGHNAQYYSKKHSRHQIIKLISSCKEDSNASEPQQELITYNLAFLDDKCNPKILSTIQVDELMSVHDFLRKMLENPELVDETDEQQQDWREDALKVVKACLKQDGSEFFQEPVIEQYFGITDYYQVIKNPIDFLTITKKLTYHGYMKKQEFENDVFQIYQNCVTYNGPDHVITQKAKSIINFFKSTWKS